MTTAPDTAEPFQLTIDIPPELGEVAVVTTFIGYSKGGAIDATTAEPKLTIGITRESKYDALKVTDRPGANLFFVVLESVRPTFDDPWVDEDDPAERLVFGD